MAWIDDRIWCHPKFTDLTPEAFSTYVRGIAYASGMSTRGHLTNEQQKLVGGTNKVKNELVRAELWDENSNGIVVHDWDDHNGKRDERKAADRERKRLARAKERETSAGQSTGTSAGQSTDVSATRPRVRARGRPPDDGSEGSDGKIKTPNPNPDVDVAAEERERILAGDLFEDIPF